MRYRKSKRYFENNSYRILETLMKRAHNQAVLVKVLIWTIQVWTIKIRMTRMMIWVKSK